MTREERLAIVKQKIAVITDKGDSEKRQGVLRKLHREKRNLEKENG